MRLIRLCLQLPIELINISCARGGHSYAILTLLLPGFSMETPYLVHAFCYQIVLDVKSNFVTLSAAHIVEFITFWKFQT